VEKKLAEPTPVRLRPVTSASIGTTAFFRNRSLLNVVLDRLAKLESSELSVLVHACSIGAEVWSLVIATDLDPRYASKVIRFEACDIEAQFIAHAQNAVYPREILVGMQPSEQEYFDSVDDRHVRVCSRLRERVQFLSSRSVVDFEAAKQYDIVLLLNALLYLPGELQSLTLNRIARYNTSLLITTGFHFDRIKADMQRNGYRPVAAGAREIHDGWTDRRRDGPVVNETIPGKIFHPWSLPTYSESEDFDYKYCSVFEKV